jgi:hypothetical protein
MQSCPQCESELPEPLPSICPSCGASLGEPPRRGGAGPDAGVAPGGSGEPSAAPSALAPAPGKRAGLVTGVGEAAFVVLTLGLGLIWLWWRTHRRNEEER